jgi:hypothetical protein
MTERHKMYVYFVIVVFLFLVMGYLLRRSVDYNKLEISSNRLEISRLKERIRVISLENEALKKTINEHTQ